MSSSIDFQPNSGQSFFSEKSFFSLSADKKKVLCTCVDGQAIVSTDEGQTFSEILMPFKEADQMAEKTATSNENSFVVSFNEGSVNHYVYDEGFKVERHLLTKCPGPLTALAMSPNGKLVICCGQNNEIKIIHLKGLNDYPIVAKLPVSHFIKAVEFNAEGTQFATVDCNGEASVYSISGSDSMPSSPILLKNEVKGEHSIERKGSFGISWSPSYLAVLSQSEFVSIYNRSNWSIVSQTRMTESIYSFSFVNDKLAFITTPSGVSAVSQHPDKAICKLAAKVVTEAIRKERIFETDQMDFCAVSAKSLILLVNANQTIYSISASISAQDLTSSKPAAKSAKNKDKAEKLEQLLMKQKLSKAEDNTEAEEEVEEDFDDEMEDSLDGDQDDDSNENLMDIDSDQAEDDQEEEEEVLPATSYRMHSTVQPGSTPWRNLQRFLAYNSVGYVTARRDSENKNIFNYDIELMDRGTYKPIRFSEEIEYELAALSEAGVLFANDFLIHFIPLTDRKQSWTIQMKPNSKPVLVAVGREYCFVALQRNVINIYTVGGIFVRTICCPDLPFSMVASDNELAFFGQDFNGITCYSFDPRTGEELNRSRVLIFAPGNDSIMWCGFNYAGILGAFTTSGRMLLRLTRNGYKWIEVLDLSQNSSQIEVAWPCYFDVMSMSVIKCTFNEPVPDPYPPKPMTEVAFSIPEAPDAATEEIVRTRLIIHETCIESSDALTEKERRKLDAVADRHVLEMAQLAIAAGRIGRVTELARFASSEKTIDLMIQLAKHHKLIAVVDELERMRFKPQKVVETPQSIPQIMPESVSVPLKVEFEAPTVSTKEAQNAPLEPQPLAPLTPIKCAPSVESVLASSSAAPSPAPVNPFAVKPGQRAQEEPQSSVMLDYISNIMKLTVKRKPDTNENDQMANKQHRG